MTSSGRKLRRGGRFRRCPRCGHRELLDIPVESAADEYSGIDPETYQRSLARERRSSARALIGDLERLEAKGPLLDVGCSFGWLLEAAERAGLEAYGVDPSESAVAAAQARGLRVRRGHFPEEDWGRRDWAVITYMDVLEHIPDLELALARTVEHLRPGGYLGIQVPVSTGAVFRAAELLEHLSLGRIDQPLRRLLQIEFPYPHLHYFNRVSLETVLCRFGMEPVSVRFDLIATGNLVDRVSWRPKASLIERLEAAGLKPLLIAGRLTGRNDLLQLIARRPQ